MTLQQLLEALAAAAPALAVPLRHGQIELYFQRLEATPEELCATLELALPDWQMVTELAPSWKNSHGEPVAWVSAHHPAASVAITAYLSREQSQALQARRHLQDHTDHPEHRPCAC